ncbi:MAG: glycosyltransferase family 39 protein [Caulobacterales bacterium]|nr:glycosyltransferase family 39 protein [Caulobacterales bacterium]
MSIIEREFGSGRSTTVVGDAALPETWSLGRLELARALSQALPGGAAWVLAGAIAVGVVFRFLGLDVNGLWWDELYVPQRFANVDMPLSEVVTVHWAGENSPPLYYFATWLWRQLFDFGDASLRLLPALASAATILFVLAFRAPPFSLPARLALAALMSVSYASVAYAHELRAYSFLIGLSTVLTVVMIRIAALHAEEEPIAPRLWIALAVAGLAASFTHYFGFLFYGACVCAVIASALATGRWRSIAWASAGGVLALALMAPFALWRMQVGVDGGNDSYSAEIAFLIHHTAIAFLRIAGHALIAAPLALLIVIELVAVSREALQDGRGLARLASAPAGMVVIASGVLVTAALAITLLVVPIYYYRSLFVLLPGVLLLAGRGGLRVRALAARLPMLSPVGAAGFLAAMFTLAFHDYWTPDKTPWREAAAYIEAQPDCARQTVVTFGEWTDFYEYYLTAEHGVRVIGFGGSRYELSPAGSVVAVPSWEEGELAAARASLDASTCSVKLWYAGAAPIAADSAAAIAAALGGDDWREIEMRGVRLFVDETATGDMEAAAPAGPALTSAS